MAKDRENSQLKTISLVIVITLVGKVLGLIRDMLMAHSFGTTWQADALSTASQLPRQFFDAVFASAISASFIPVFNEYMETEGRDSAFRLSGSFLTIIGLVSAGLSALAMVFSPQIVNLLASYNAETAALCASLSRIIFPSIFFTAMAFSMVGILNSLGEFNVPAAMSIAANGIVIAYYLFFARQFGVWGAAAALLLGWAAQALIQMPSLRKKGYRFTPGFRHPGLKKIFFLMLPVMVSSWIQPINQMIVTRFASRFVSGASSMAYVNSLYIMIAGIFVLSVTNVIFPEMSRLSVSGDRSAFSGIITSTTRTLLFLLIPMTVGLMLMGEPIIRLLYEYRSFDGQSTAQTAGALFYLSLGMVGYGVQNVLVRAFYAVKNGRIPMISGIVSIGVNLLLCLLLVEPMGISGLALASAIASLVSALILIPPAQKLTEGTLVTRSLLGNLAKMLAAALVMGVAVWLARDGLAGVLGSGIPSRALLVAAPAVLGVVVYMGLAKLLNIEQAQQVFGLLGKLRKGDR